MSDEPLRLGIVGAARIAGNFAQGVADSGIVSVVAIASREVSRARAFADANGIAESHGDYDELLRRDDIDAVYIPLPNGLHGEWAIRAAEAGKHVLCEKPLASNATEARAMFAAAHRHGVHLVEAFPYRSQPQTLMLRQLLAEGIIGEVKTIHAHFGATLADRHDIRFDPSLAGGALMDLGSYPLSLIRMIAGGLPCAMQALGHWDATGVDLAAMASLRFPNGMLAQAACSFQTAVYRQALIGGTDGSIETTYANHSSDDHPPVLRIKRGTARRDAYEEIPAPGMNGFRAEAESFATLVRGGEWNGITEQESIDVAVMLDALRDLVREGAG